jgi:hypothetical protein
MVANNIGRHLSMNHKKKEQVHLHEFGLINILEKWDP